MENDIKRERQGRRETPLWAIPAKEDGKKTEDRVRRRVIWGRERKERAR